MRFLCIDKQISDEEHYAIPSTIDEVAIVDEIKTVYKKNKVGQFKN